MPTVDPSDLLDALAKCLDAQIKESRGPDVCFVGVVPGEAAVADNLGTCDGGRQGVAWVRAMTIYPASAVNVLNEQVNNCGGGTGMDVELGMLRPFAPVSDARGRPPTPDTYAAATRLQNDDSLIMQRAITCCTMLRDLDFIVGQYTPAPVLNAVGGTWSVAVMLD